MKPAFLSDFEPSQGILEGVSNYSKVEACIVGDEVSLGVLINEGLKIFRLNESMLPPVRYGSQSHSWDSESVDKLGFGIDRDWRP